MAKNDIIQRVELIQRFPCFASLTQNQRQELARLMQEVRYAPGESILAGEAEVTRAVEKRKKLIHVPVATLHEGEAIGLNDMGYYSQTGKRTATVTAISHMLLLRLEVSKLYAFLKQHQLESSMYAASINMLRIRFIKQSLPFSKLSHERLQWLADRVEEEHVSAGTVLFQEGDEGDKCYLIRSGQVEITAKDDSGNG